ncbi:hypothetical protein [Reyranella sp.]|uniref:hypothetical protein n=1 Tax=Reyranella sp. TaxID=1929291 RepID=UPI003F6EC1D4
MLIVPVRPAGGDALWGRAGASVYAGYADIYQVTGYDVVDDFVSGTSKLDLTALGVNASRIVIQSDGGSTSLHVEATPGAFDSPTDLAASFTSANAIGPGGYPVARQPGSRRHWCAHHANGFTGDCR